MRISMRNMPRRRGRPRGRPRHPRPRVPSGSPPSRAAAGAPSRPGSRTLVAPRAVAGGRPPPSPGAPAAAGGSASCGRGPPIHAPCHRSGWGGRGGHETAPPTPAGFDPCGDLWWPRPRGPRGGGARPFSRPRHAPTALLPATRMPRRGRRCRLRPAGGRHAGGADRRATFFAARAPPLDPRARSRPAARETAPACGSVACRLVHVAGAVGPSLTRPRGVRVVVGGGADGERGGGCPWGISLPRRAADAWRPARVSGMDAAGGRLWRGGGGRRGAGGGASPRRQR